MTYESLMIANQTITKIEVKGKEYAEVNQRIRVFRMLYPNGSIETNIESLGKGICVMSAVVKDDFGSVLGVGHAYEKEDSSFINKTSYIENCETSAVGRALGLPGIHIECKRVEKLNIYDAVEQSKNDARTGEMPVVMHRKNRKGWLVTMPLDDWMKLYEKMVEEVQNA